MSATATLPGPESRCAEPGRYLTFTAGGDAYGLPVKRVREIIRNTTQLTPIPQMPAYVSGCLNLRGTVIPVVDLRRKFGVPPVGNASLNCVVITDVRVGAQVLPTGLIVDTVEEVVNLKAADLEPAPEFGGGLDTSFVQGMAKLKERLVTLLDLDQVLARATLQQLQAGVEAVPAAAAVKAA